MSEQQTKETSKMENFFFDMMEKAPFNPFDAETVKKVMEPWMNVYNLSVEQMTDMQKQMMGQWQENMGTMTSLTQEGFKQMNTMMQQGQEIFQSQLSKFRN